MLVAEIHGHHVAEAANSEDYLTSSVFGHLRYLTPAVFWQELFRYALGMPNGTSRTLAEYLEKQGVEIGTLEQLSVYFWPRHSLHGIPDLILIFTAPNARSLVIVVEAKLWSEKSGTGDFDQIARYLRLLDDPNGVNPKIPESSLDALIYLTEHDSLAELEASVNAYEDADKGRARVFRLQWQDIVVAARAAISSVIGTDKLILQDVARFLSGRNLEYFRGFNKFKLLNTTFHTHPVVKQRLFFPVPLPSLFQAKSLLQQGALKLFALQPLPNHFTILKGPWCYDHRRLRKAD
jgi:hypothetical protein